jgi:hypothetical protein
MAPSRRRAALTSPSERSATMRLARGGRSGRRIRFRLQPTSSIEAALERAPAASFEDWRFLCESALPAFASRSVLVRAASLRIPDRAAQADFAPGPGRQGAVEHEYVIDGGRIAGADAARSLGRSEARRLPHPGSGPAALRSAVFRPEPPRTPRTPHRSHARRPHAAARCGAGRARGRLLAGSSASRSSSTRRHGS